MLTELAERDATGEIAVIYDEVRRFCAVPYVSAIHRHLATRPGWLPWVWAALRPVFASGAAQPAAWRATERIDTPRLPPISRGALRVWGVDDAGEAAIRAVCESFVRVSPTNMVLAGLLRRLLAGDQPAGAGASASFTPPPAPASLPPLVDIAARPPAEQAVLTSLATPVAGRPFVPGLYRMLGGWPAYFAHVATVLHPHLGDPATLTACRSVTEAVDVELPRVFAALPPLPAHPPMPPSHEFPGVLEALDTYRKTSPEMVVFGLMIRNAMPPPSSLP
jgi:halocarboxylic acid dehydrogenase DehI